MFLVVDPGCGSEMGGYPLTRKKYYEAQHDDINCSETLLLCNRCACNWKISSQRILECNWRVHRKYLMEAPELHKRIPARKPCVADVLYNCWGGGE